MKWITAVDLQHWADTIQSRAVFPAMIADLIRASVPDISSIRFPSGDKGQVRGFDGNLAVDHGSSYVPEGKSIWEFGVSSGGAAKATSDYDKRTKEVAPEIRSQTSFVFVSPRTWDATKKENLIDWVNEKNAQKKWKDVRYIDGSMVEDWLAECPAVAARYAKKELHLVPLVGARSTDDYWDEYSTRFYPTLAEKVLLAGREEQANKLVRRLMEGSGLLLYAADSPEEVVAFSVAAIRLAEPSARLFLESKVLIVDSDDSARQLSVRKNLVFLPRAKAKDMAGYLSLYGPTIASAGMGDKHSSYEVLKRPNSLELGSALTFMGMSEREGYDLARKCGRSLAVLARRIPNGTKPIPEWRSEGKDLLPALLAGAWSSVLKQDQEVLCTLGNKTQYTQIEVPLREFAKLQDPPVDHVGDVWTMRASVDAFVHLGHLIGPEHLEQFKLAATSVFSKTVEPPKADEVFKPTSRKLESHSDWLRNGMMNTLLHMAVLHEQADFSIPGTTPQDFVNRIVRELPGLSTDHRLLASLEEQLAILAEAAPIPFLEALERLLEGDAEGIKPIFEEHPGFISSHSYHCGLLWALEVIAWDPKLLYRSAKCLARLAVIDPGGRVANRPINSLRAIFLAWAPNTAASAAKRTDVLSELIREVPEIAWELLTKLLPTWSDIGGVTQKPVFREYEEEAKEILTYRLVWNCQDIVVEKALSLAGQDAERWDLLISKLSNFPKQSFDATLTALETVLDAAALDIRFKIWGSLRKVVNRHITYANADWAFPPEIHSRLELLLSKYQPQDAVQLSIWLFDEWLPDVPERRGDGKDITEAINEARVKALKLVIELHGVQGLLELASKVKLPQHVGFTLRMLDMPFDLLLKIFQESVSYNSNLDILAGVVLFEGATRFGKEWLVAVKKLLLNIVDCNRIARILMSLDESQMTWEYVATFGGEVRDHFWKNKHSYFINGSSDDLKVANQNYLIYSRPIAAIDASSNRLNDVSSDLLMQMLDGAIDEISADKHSIVTMHEYSIEQVFEELGRRTDVSVDDLAKREFAYLPIFRHTKKQLTLHRLMTERAELYMDIIAMVFRPKGVETPPPTEAEQQRAVIAYELLDSISVLPGQDHLDVNADILLSWCAEVRKLATKSNLIEVADTRIGHLLAHAPCSSNDGAWPHESVRSVLESLASDEMEQGISVERFNMRGVFSKAIGEGGDQERKLAEQSKSWAETISGSPRTVAMLMRISESWMREAAREDLSAEKERLRW